MIEFTELTALPWMSYGEAFDLLRVSADNAAIIEAHASAIPSFVEVTTGYKATCTSSPHCDGMVRQLCRYLLCLWFNPDGTDAAKLARVVDSLTASTKALVIATGEEAKS